MASESASEDIDLKVPSQNVASHRNDGADFNDSDQDAFKIPFENSRVSEGKVEALTDERDRSEKTAVVTCPYDPPLWATIPDPGYSLEVVRNGTIVNRVDLSSSGKSYFIIGRLPDHCDISTENPSCSRFHAILQFGQKDPDDKKGFYLYDLTSTHGTFLNKIRLPAATYQRLQNGFVMKFGQSTRLYVMQGPGDGEEEEQDQVTMADMRVAKAAALEKKSDDTAKEVPKETEDSGIDWGFGTDASDEVEEKEVGFLEAAVSGDDAYFRDDPKKALNAFFVREGMDMEYDVEEIGQGYKKQFLCRIPLPVETTNGRQLVAEATVHGKKKEALAAAILEACRILHAKGVLKGTTSVGRQRKARNWADEDYYDSDEDAYLDRTGTVERKRQQRMQRAKTAKQETETFDSLSQRLEDVKKEMLDVTEKLQMADKNKAASMGDGGVDALDSFMEAIKSGLIMDPKTKIKLRQRLSELKLEEARLIRLINIVKPLDLPAILPSFSSKPLKPEPEPNAEGFSYGRLKAAPLPPRSAPVYDHGNVEEFKAEEDDEDGGRGDAGDQNKDVQSSTAFQDPVSQVIFDCAPTKTANEQQNEAVNSEIKRKTSMSTSPEEERIISSGSAADVRPYLPQSKKKKIDRKGNYEYDASDPDYAMWVPPEDQAGDGKTNLNARLGY